MGQESLSAAFSGDANFNSGSGTAKHLVLYSFVNVAFPDGGFWGNKNLGAAVPLRWQLADALGTSMATLLTNPLTAIVKISSIFNSATANADGSCTPSLSGTNPVVLYNPATGATGGSNLRYDSTSNQYLFNWDSSQGTSTGPGCYTVILQLSDNSIVLSSGPPPTYGGPIDTSKEHITAVRMQ